MADALAIVTAMHYICRDVLLVGKLYLGGLHRRRPGVNTLGPLRYRPPTLHVNDG